MKYLEGFKDLISKKYFELTNREISEDKIEKILSLLDKDKRFYDYYYDKRNYSDTNDVKQQFLVDILQYGFSENNDVSKNNEYFNNLFDQINEAKSEISVAPEKIETTEEKKPETIRDEVSDEDKDQDDSFVGNEVSNDEYSQLVNSLFNDPDHTVINSEDFVNNFNNIKNNYNGNFYDLIIEKNDYELIEYLKEHIENSKKAEDSKIKETANTFLADIGLTEDADIKNVEKYRLEELENRLELLKDTNAFEIDVVDFVQEVSKKPLEAKTFSFEDIDNFKEEDIHIYAELNKENENKNELKTGIYENVEPYVKVLTSLQESYKNPKLTISEKLILKKAFQNTYDTLRRVGDYSTKSIDENKNILDNLSNVYKKNENNINLSKENKEILEKLTTELDGFNDKNNEELNKNKDYAVLNTKITNFAGKCEREFNKQYIETELNKANVKIKDLDDNILNGLTYCGYFGMAALANPFSLIGIVCIIGATVSAGVTAVNSLVKAGKRIQEKIIKNSENKKELVQKFIPENPFVKQAEKIKTKKGKENKGEIGGKSNGNTRTQEKNSNFGKPATGTGNSPTPATTSQDKKLKNKISAAEIDVENKEYDKKKREIAIAMRVLYGNTNKLNIDFENKKISIGKNIEIPQSIAENLLTIKNKNKKGKTVEKVTAQSLYKKLNKYYSDIIESHKKEVSLEAVTAKKCMEQLDVNIIKSVKELDKIIKNPEKVLNKFENEVKNRLEYDIVKLLKIQSKINNYNSRINDLEETKKSNEKNIEMKKAVKKNDIAEKTENYIIDATISVEEDKIEKLDEKKETIVDILNSSLKTLDSSKNDKKGKNDFVSKSLSQLTGKESEKDLTEKARKIVDNIDINKFFKLMKEKGYNLPKSSIIKSDQEWFEQKTNIPTDQIRELIKGLTPILAKIREKEQEKSKKIKTKINNFGKRIVGIGGDFVVKVLGSKTLGIDNYLTKDLVRGDSRDEIIDQRTK